MQGMGRTVLCLGVILVTAGLVPIAHAQKRAPYSDRQDDWHYSNPSAAKSVEIGNYYLRRKKLHAALSRFKEAVKTDPHYAPAYLGLGKVYQKTGLKQKALDAYQRYLDELPSEKEAQEAKDVHKAIAHLQRQLGPDARPKREAPPSQ